MCHLFHCYHQMTVRLYKVRIWRYCSHVVCCDVTVTFVTGVEQRQQFFKREWRWRFFFTFPVFYVGVNYF